MKANRCLFRTKLLINYYVAEFWKIQRFKKSLYDIHRCCYTHVAYALAQNTKQAYRNS